MPAGFMVGKVGVGCGVISLDTRAWKDVAPDKPLQCFTGGIIDNLRCTWLVDRSLTPTTQTLSTAPQPVNPWRFESVKFPRCFFGEHPRRFLPLPMPGSSVGTGALDRANGSSRRGHSSAASSGSPREAGSSPAHNRLATTTPAKARAAPRFRPGPRLYP